MDLKILYEDNDMLAIDKPSGLVVHFDGRTKEPSVCDWFLENYPASKEVGEPLILQNKTAIQRPGVVHRLDRETSGVLILAKTQDAYLHLKQQFHDRLATKEYRALLYGHMKDDTGIIDRPIGRSKKDPRVRSAMRGASGKLRDAQTEYKVISRNEIDGERVTNVAAFPKTGRTHQLRAHFKSLNHPIVCDPLYAPKQVCPASIGRLALHAHAIEIELPNGEKKRIKSKLPDYFLNEIGIY